MPPYGSRAEIMPLRREGRRGNQTNRLVIRLEFVHALDDSDTH